MCSIYRQGCVLHPRGWQGSPVLWSAPKGYAVFIAAFSVPQAWRRTASRLPYMRDSHTRKQGYRGNGISMRYQRDRLAKPILLPMDTRGQAFPKPGPKPSSELTKDGRLIETPRRYRITKHGMWAKQAQRCGMPGCHNFMPTPAYGHRHHPGGRGMGGSRRDDSRTVLICIPCHQKVHGK